MAVSPLSDCPGDEISCGASNDPTTVSFTNSDNDATSLPLAISARKISLVISEIDASMQ